MRSDLYRRRDLAGMLNMQNVNNGTAVGGVGNMLSQALAGYMQGMEEKQDRLDQAEASKAMLDGMKGRPEVQNAPGPNMGGDAGYTIPGKAGGYDGALSALGGLQNNPYAGRLAQDLLTQKMALDEARRKPIQISEGETLFDPMSGKPIFSSPAKPKDPKTVNTAEGVFVLNHDGSLGKRLGSAPAQLQIDNRPPRQVQTVQTAEGVFTINPDGILGNRLGGSPRANASQVIGQDEMGNPIYGAQAKPMPPAALKLQQEELDAIGGASSISADMGAARKMIEEGKLQLGPWQNLVSKGQNFAGMSDENSRNFASFNATLEKARNDSLRLNKGVQTEGDAVRAWNELLSNINDPALVKQRLAEIEQINARGASLRKLNVDNIRQNYGLNPLDTSGYERVAPAIGGGGLSADEEAELAALRKRFGR